MTSNDHGEATLARAVELVEEAISGLGVDPRAGRSERDGRVTFVLRRGSARILVALHPAQEGREDGRLRVVAPVVRLPPEERQLGLFRWLLESNASELVGAAFAVSDEEVVVVAERSVEDLDASEVDALIRTVGRVADAYDDRLAKAFGAPRSSDG